MLEWNCSCPPRCYPQCINRRKNKMVAFSSSFKIHWFYTILFPKASPIWTVSSRNNIPPVMVLGRGQYPIPVLIIFGEKWSFRDTAWSTGLPPQPPVYWDAILMAHVTLSLGRKDTTIVLEVILRESLHHGKGVWRHEDRLPWQQSVCYCWVKAFEVAFGPT